MAAQEQNVERTVNRQPDSRLTEALPLLEAVWGFLVSGVKLSCYKRAAAGVPMDSMVAAGCSPKDDEVQLSRAAGLYRPYSSSALNCANAGRGARR